MSQNACNYFRSKYYEQLRHSLDNYRRIDA